jgi:hypothetical protein
VIIKIKMATGVITTAYGTKLDRPIIFNYSWETGGDNEQEHRNKARQKAMHKALVEAGIFKSDNDK